MSLPSPSSPAIPFPIQISYLRSMRKLKTHELDRVDLPTFKSLAKKPLVVVLDSIRSMNNVGAVFRSSDAFLVEKVMLCGYTPRPPHREITKTAIGAEESVDWEHIQDIRQCLRDLKAEGYTILLLEQTDSSLPLPEFQIQPGARYALVLGNEVMGVSEEAIALGDLALEIPQWGTKHSLNISVATGIALYHLTQQL